jgi:hypothetical protein
LVWCIAAASIAVILLLGGILYVSPATYRYLIPVLFWPLIFVAIAATQWGGRTATRAAWCMLLLLGAAFMVRAYERNFVPATATWRDALATCLLEQRDALGLKAGIAQYWLARPATIGSNWTMQIDPVVGDGVPFVWGNNPWSYLKSIQNRAQPPAYNFIVIDDLDTEALRRKFGAPERTAPCGPRTLWVYAEPLRGIVP